MNRSIGANSSCGTSYSAQMLDSNQGGDIAPFETIDQPPGNRLPTNVSGKQPTKNHISHSFWDGQKVGDSVSGGGAYSNPKAYLRSSEGPLILQAIKIHKTPLDVRVDGKPANGQPVSTGLNHEERRYVKLAARAVGSPSNEDKFYPYTDSDCSLTHEDGFEFCRPTNVNVMAHFAIRSTDLRSKVQNTPLSVLEFAIAQLSARHDKINHFGLPG